MSGVLVGIETLKSFDNSKLVPGKPVVVKDFNWGCIFVYENGPKPEDVIGVNSSVTPNAHWVDLIANFVVNYAQNNLANKDHTHESTEIVGLETWASDWLKTQNIDAGKIVNLVFPAPPVNSVNGQTGNITLTAADIGAIAPGDIIITTEQIDDWETAFQQAFNSLLINSNINFSQITDIPVESPTNWDDIESKPTFLLEFEALSISSLVGFLYHSGPDAWELREVLTIADVTNLQSTLDAKQASHPSLSGLATIGDNGNVGYLKKTGLNSWQVTNSIGWEEVSNTPRNLAEIAGAALTEDGLLRKTSGNWAIVPNIDWGDLENIPAILKKVAAIATSGYLKLATDGSIEAVEEVVRPPRPGIWGPVRSEEIGDVPIIVVPEDLKTNQRYISFATDETVNVNIYCKIGGPPDLAASPPSYSFILRPGKQINNDNFLHNGQAIWAATPSSTQALQIQIAPAAVDYTGAEDLTAYQLIAGKGQPNGYAPLGHDTKVPQLYLPAIAMTNTYPVASEAAMLALTAQTGDVAVRTDIGQTFILQGSDPSLLADWQELLSPGTVTSVNGQIGAVVINDIAGNAGSATSLKTARNISVDNDITGSVLFDGSSDIALTATIAADAVTDTKLADVNEGTIKGRASAGVGDPENLTAAQARTLLNVADGATANSTDANLRDRSTHTGTQAASTVTYDPTASELTATQVQAALDEINSALNSAKALLSALGTLANQNEDSVNIAGGNIAGITDLAIADGGTGDRKSTRLNSSHT